MGHFEFLTRRHGDILHHRPIVVLHTDETRIHVPIENVTLEQVNHLLRGVNANRLFQRGKEIVDVDRQARNVVHVRMSDNDIADGLPLESVSAIAMLPASTVTQSSIRKQVSRWSFVAQPWPSNVLGKSWIFTNQPW